MNQWRVLKENFYFIFNDCLLFHHWYTIIDLSTFLFLNICFPINAEISIFTSLFSSFELLLRLYFQKWDYYWLKEYKYYYERLFLKRKESLSTQPWAMYYYTGFIEPGQHWVLSFNFLGADIITVKRSILLISTPLITVELNILPCPHVWFHLALVSFCPFFSLGYQCLWFVYYIFIYFLHMS